MEIKVMKNIMYNNNKIADDNREYQKNNGLVSLNILASPGAGKTSVIVKIIEKLCDKMKLAVIEGDIAGSIDAEKIEELGIPVVQINTAGGCHLDANMFKQALDILKPAEGTLILIENVGNLVCPASFDLGETGRIVISSTTEGNDKPVKYPKAFQTADVVVLNKSDLLEHVSFNSSIFYKGLGSVYSGPVFELSCVNGSGTAEFVKWIEDFCIRARS